MQATPGGPVLAATVQFTRRINEQLRGRLQVHIVVLFVLEFQRIHDGVAGAVKTSSV